MPASAMDLTCLAALASAATAGGLAALQASLGAFCGHTGPLASYTVIDTGGRVHTTGPGGVGILVGQRRRGGRVTHF